MKNESPFPCRILILKSLVIQSIFLLLHYTYDFFPGKLSAIFSGINESMFQHLKIAFFSISLTNILEFFYTKNKINRTHFISVRVFSTVLYPWIIFLLFYIPPAIIGKFSVMWVEIVVANLILFISSMYIIVVENEFLKISLSNRFKIMTVLLYGISAFLYIHFTFHAPWFDVFAIPPGW